MITNMPNINDVNFKVTKSKINNVNIVFNGLLFTNYKVKSNFLIIYNTITNNNSNKSKLINLSNLKFKEKLLTTDYYLNLVFEYIDSNQSYIMQIYLKSESDFIKLKESLGTQDFNFDLEPSKDINSSLMANKLIEDYFGSLHKSTMSTKYPSYNEVKNNKGIEVIDDANLEFNNLDQFTDNYSTSNNFLNNEINIRIPANKINTQIIYYAKSKGYSNYIEDDEILRSSSFKLSEIEKIELDDDLINENLQLLRNIISKNIEKNISMDSLEKTYLNKEIYEKSEFIINSEKILEKYSDINFDFNLNIEFLKIIQTIFTNSISKYSSIAINILNSRSNQISKKDQFILQYIYNNSLSLLSAYTKYIETKMLLIKTEKMKNIFINKLSLNNNITNNRNINIDYLVNSNLQNSITSIYAIKDILTNQWNKYKK